MLMGVLPLTFVAALIESYITRHTEAPLFLRVSFVIGGFLLVSWLTIFLPQRLHRHGHTL
jgi:putative transmembrane protein